MSLPAAITVLLTTLLFTIAQIATAQSSNFRTFNQQYGPFNQTYYDIFTVVRPATISNDALQVTPDSASDDFSLFNHSGRVLLNQIFRLWDQNGVASFNTSFLVNIYSPRNNTAGEGLAFVIAPDLNLPVNSSGQYLGLTNAITDGSSGNRFIAVELDTFMDASSDPDNNHIGIDINSVRSNITARLSPYNITLAPPFGDGARFYNVWVDYDGVGMVLSVFIIEQSTRTGPTPAKPQTPIISLNNVNLSSIVNQDSYFGFSASTGYNNSQLNCVLRWNLTTQYIPIPADSEDRRWIPILLGVGIPILVVLLGVAIWGWCRYKRRKELSSFSNLTGALLKLPGMPKEFLFKDLKKATNGFDDKNKLGQGGFGAVYRGWLVDDNLDIAVKWFLRDQIKGEEDFLSELTIINRLRHKHLVKLLGWCHQNGKLLLVYEYMPNGSLDQHLFAGPEKEPLSWNLRYKIITGTASALHYLHNEFDQRVVHRDLKASNIMLDAHFNAQLGDFGLARAIDNEKTSYAEVDGVMGTIGYIAPECLHTMKATGQSDVYAFGAVLLEIVCGQRPGTKIGPFSLLVDWVWSLHREGKLLEAVDKNLGDDYLPEEATRLLLLGLACSHPTDSERPKTQEILGIISGTVPAPVVPPFKPYFCWPSSGPIDISSLDVTMTTQYSTGSTVATTHLGSGPTSQYLSKESAYNSGR